MSETTPDISVVIVSWNARGFLNECLKSLDRLHLTSRIETIVVDNASTDGSPDLVKECFPQSLLIRNDENLGFARANNIGIIESRGRYVCLVNSDVVVLDGCLDRLCAFMDDNPDIGIGAPRILNSDMTTQYSCRHAPTLWRKLCETLRLDRMLPGNRIFSAEEMKWFHYETVTDVDALSGCFLMARREAVERVGGLDERFFMYSEDIDWCARIRNAGWRVTFYPGAEAIHHRGASSSNAPLDFSIEKEKALFLFWKKYNGLPSRFGLFLVFLLFHGLRIFMGSLIFLLKPSLRKRCLSSLGQHFACLRALLISSGFWSV